MVTSNEMGLMLAGCVEEGLKLSLSTSSSVQHFATEQLPKVNLRISHAIVSLF